MFSFLLKYFVVRKDSVSPGDFEKNIFICIYLHKKYMWDQEFWPLSLQPAELHYILLVFLCWMENSCSRSLHIITFVCQSWSTVKKMAPTNVTSWNKTDRQNFPKKCLFTLRMITRVGMNGKIVNTSRIFCIEFREWLDPWFCHRVIDWCQYGAGWQKHGFPNSAKFPMKWLSTLKTFLFQKSRLLFKSWWCSSCF